MEETEPKIDTDRLTSLEKEDSKTEEAPPEPETMAKEQLEEANRKLMDILSSGKDK